MKIRAEVSEGRLLDSEEKSQRTTATLPASVPPAATYRGTSLIRNCHPHRTTGLFLMSEVPL